MLRTLRVAFSLLLFLGVALGLVRNALAADADVLREAKDRAEIEALMWRYVRALDSYDEDAYASVFTEDGQFGVGPNATKGRAALREMVMGLERSSAERRAAGTPMYHVITNAHIEFVSEDEARFHSYWMTVYGAAGSETAPRVAAVGRGMDELVRRNGEWLIKSRNVSPQD